ncbi:hypothetical protein NPIL_225201 [Nephila pilipes]|uniref:Uncharacterized protein n=1 Tax=Nephila pilipes TaxID=299642 RepID=A0A8X6UNE3_NEPPI|nr:hypothetical protein NPIL_225201 [Nephila pilipes]
MGSICPAKQCVLLAASKNVINGRWGQESFLNLILKLLMQEYAKRFGLQHGFQSRLKSGEVRHLIIEGLSTIEQNAAML